MSNEITAYFKGRTGVAESVYQYDYGRVLVFDDIELPSVFEVHFELPGSDEAIIVAGQDNRAAIPNACLDAAGIVTAYVYAHEGQNDAETEYIVRFNVMHRAKPIDDGSEKEQSFMSDAIALMQHVSIEGEVANWLEDHPEATTTVQDKAITEAKLSDSLNEKIKWAFKGKVKLITIDCLQKAACNALIDEDGNFILIDFGLLDTAQTVIDAIETNGGITLVACILSHAHYDHIGGTGENGAYKEIISNFTRASNFTVYAPSRPGYTTASSVIADYDEFIDYVGELGTVVAPPTAEQPYVINGLTFEFYNTDISKYYEQGENYNYNDTCLCCSVEVGSNVIGFYGDIYSYGESEVCQENIKGNTIMIAPHHGNANNVNYDFIAKTNPKYIIGNRGSQNSENGMLGAITAILIWANNNNAGFYDTANNGTFVFDIDANNIATEAVPYLYPQVITDYASFRGACTYNEVTPSTTTTIKELIRSMETNSSITCFVTNGYQVAIDLGITAAIAFLKITKFTGGASNNLSDRDTSDMFYFAIEIVAIYDICHKQNIFGKYNNDTFVIYPDDTANSSIVTIDTAGNITVNTATPFISVPEQNKITINRSGAYKLTITNISNNSDANLVLDSTTLHVPAGGSAVYRVEKAAGTYSLTAQNHTLLCIFEWIPPRYNFPIA